MTPEYSTTWLQRIERPLARLVHRRPLAMANTVGMVSISFDDVEASACHEGRRVLEDEGVHGTFYACGGLTDRPGMHTRGDLVSLARAGHELASHGFEHLNYQTHDDRRLALDIERNRDFLLQLQDGRVPTHFAYPYGCVNARAKRLAGQHFQSARGITDGLNAGTVDSLLLRGTKLYEPRVTREVLASWMRDAAARRGWLILLTHDVDESPTAFGVRPGTLRLAIRLAREHGLPVLSVQEAFARAKAPAASAPTAVERTA